MIDHVETLDQDADAHRALRARRRSAHRAFKRTPRALGTAPNIQTETSKNQNPNFAALCALPAAVAGGATLKDLRAYPPAMPSLRRQRAQQRRDKADRACGYYMSQPRRRPSSGLNQIGLREWQGT